jgi:hypothetical protein
MTAHNNKSMQKMNTFKMTHITLSRETKKKRESDRETYGA